MADNHVAQGSLRSVANVLPVAVADMALSNGTWRRQLYSPSLPGDLIICGGGQYDAFLFLESRRGLKPSQPFIAEKIRACAVVL